MWTDAKSKMRRLPPQRFGRIEENGVWVSLLSVLCLFFRDHGADWEALVTGQEQVDRCCDFCAQPRMLSFQTMVEKYGVFLVIGLVVLLILFLKFFSWKS